MGEYGAMSVATTVSLDHQKRARDTKVFSRPVLVSVALVVLVALAPRLIGIGWGSPYEYHPDEHFILDPAIQMATSHDLNPHWFHYPSLVINAEAMAIETVHRVGGWPLERNDLPGGASGNDVKPILFPYVVLGRVLVALSGVIGCLAVFVALRSLRASLLAATFGALSIALAPLAVTNAHDLTTDVPSSAFVALALCFSAPLSARRRPDLLVLAGATSGLAASSKYNAGLIVLVPLLLLAISRPGKSGLRGAILVVGAAIIAFALTSPFVLLDASTALRDVSAELAHYRTGHLGAEGPDNWRWYAETLTLAGWGPSSSLASGIELVVGILERRYRRFAIAVLIYGGSYLGIIGAPAVRFDRNLLPLLPPLAILAGFAAHALITWGATRVAEIGAGWVEVVGVIVSAVAIVLLLAPAVDQDIQADVSLAGPIAREEYTPQLEWIRSDSLGGWTLAEHPLTWYRAHGYRFVVTSSFMSDRYLAAGGGPADEYRAIFAEPLVAQFSPRDGMSVGPTIQVYRIDD